MAGTNTDKWDRLQVATGNVMRAIRDLNNEIDDIDNSLSGSVILQVYDSNIRSVKYDGELSKMTIEFSDNIGECKAEAFLKKIEQEFGKQFVSPVISEGGD